MAKQGIHTGLSTWPHDMLVYKVVVY
ncbi:hypothetical protein F383_05756 [Gossypium arboreum]|uniref:Uncharacterized protein n=1 Tax=Gossypium arboreum TaxID=29729 RepID=A0A0B0N1C6_GOSAR|nr:hypothetical protein F383_05756 [Gossypium arboreum]